MTPVDWPTTDLLDRRAKTTPDRLALVDADEGRRWSYGELDREVDELAHGLDAIDADRLGILAETGPRFVRLLFAAMRTRTTLVSLSTRERVPELERKVRRAGVDTVVCEPSTSAVAEQLPVETCYVLDETASDTGDTVNAFPRPNDGGIREPTPLDAAWDQLIGFTSGTAGEPKAVRLTLANLVASATASAFRLGVERKDRWLVALPMYHMGGLAPVIRSTLYGTTVLTRASFDPESTIEVIATHDVTGISLVPTMVRRLLDVGWEPPDHLRFVLLGGAPASTELLDRCLAADVPVYPTYGTTETASQVATATPEQVRERPESVGQALFGTEVTIVETGDGAVDAKPRKLDPDEIGEIVVAGPTVTPGYLDDELTAASFCEYGFRTGDLGRLDDDGFLTVTGRVSDQIVTGGENVDPAEVREVLSAHASVETAAVVGLADEEWGERVGAAVVPAEASDRPSTAEASDRPSTAEASDRPSTGELEDHCAERLAGYKRPRTLLVVDSLPRTASGTVDRAGVRELLERAGDS